jgi:hypothetical protein
MSITLLPGSNLLSADKDPDATLRYGLDLRDVLAGGDAVQSVTISAQTGVTADQPTVSGSTVLCRVAGGTVGQPASVTLRWVTAQGDTDERTLHFRITQR